MMTAFCIVLALGAAALLTELIAASSAPMGYEDEAGFHFGQPRSAQSAISELQNPS